MLTSKAQAFAFLFLVLWTTSAFSAGHGTKHQTVTITTDTSDTTDDSKPARSPTVTGPNTAYNPITNYFSHPYSGTGCSIACETSDAVPDFRMRFVLPYTSLPFFLTSRFTIHSFDQGPSWMPQYSSTDWIAGGGLELPLSTGVSLWAELSRTASTGIFGCGSCLFSGPSTNNYQMDVVRIGFVMRN